MVVGAFPVVKLGALLLKQLSKPIANFSKQRAKNNYFFRTYICMPPAQFYNWCEIKTKMWVMNLGKPVNVPQLNEAMAIELGANMLGETIVFSIAAGILYFEYARQVQKELDKEKARQEELSQLNYTIQNMYFTVERQDSQIRELLQSVSDLEKRHAFLPKRKKNEPQPPPPVPPLVLPPTPLVTGPPKGVQEQNPPSSSSPNKGNHPIVSNPHQNSSVISGAMTILENEFLPEKPSRYENGLVMKAVEYAQHELFRHPQSSTQRAY
ncbi:putative OPA3-like protein CG13603 [Frankliniella occidentalis]|uniref:OPA3-like protein CG13603 n=1 Tax=Frankliniella occidentalis TaxID=133901 RepID=A0A6J1TL97_FRAOC|nr:putative OPA3-like protein CG13603 [Frankliniella occidentalis]